MSDALDINAEGRGFIAENARQAAYWTDLARDAATIDGDKLLEYATRQAAAYALALVGGGGAGALGRLSRREADVIADLRGAAGALGGDIVGRNSILCPGPRHGPRDRSLSVRVDPRAPDGFLTNSFAGDDWRECRDYVRRVLGINRNRDAAFRRPPEDRRQVLEPRPRYDDSRFPALALWRSAVDPRDTLVERYVKSRELEIGDDITGHALRWHPGVGAMIALFRNVETDEPQAISRTFLDSEGRKTRRKFLGPVGGAAIKLDPDERVLSGLHVAEGIETALAGRRLGLRPAWALGSAGGLASFPVLPGVESLTLLAENDEASARAVDACAKRWHEAGREVFINRATIGKDLNDAIRGVA